MKVTDQDHNGNFEFIYIMTIAEAVKINYFQRNDHKLGE